MSRVRPPLVALVLGLGLGLLAATGQPARAGGERLGPVVRVQVAGPTGCHVEGESAVAVTRVGTWVAFNDGGECAPQEQVTGFRVTALALVPTGAVQARAVTLPPLEPTLGYAGDPALAVDADGAGVVLASLSAAVGPPMSGDVISTHHIGIEVVRIDAQGRSRRLPPITRDGAFDDKEAVAVDRGVKSPRKGWVYVVWDRGGTNEVTLRAFDGRRWGPYSVVRSGAAGHPDVAVNSRGDVAVATETPAGVEVRTSSNGGRTLSPPVRVVAGTEPGHLAPDCPLVNVVGRHQRVLRNPRLAWDARGALHLVSAAGPGSAVVGVSGTESAVVHAVSRDGGQHWSAPETVATKAWQPAVTPQGTGVAIAYLQVIEGLPESYTAHLRSSSGADHVLSPNPATLLRRSAREAVNCYGIGDYAGLGGDGRSVTFGWATTDGVALPGLDSDVLVRSVG